MSYSRGMLDSMTLSEYLVQNRDRHLEELLDFLRIPSISTDSRRAADVHRAAEFVRDELERAGLRASVMETARHPVAFGEYQASPDAPTVLIYGHYDVQPPEPLELWDSPPFEPVVTGGSIIARGASDDKGQVYAHIKGAEAVRAVTGKLPVNLKFLVEGEEEIGSPNLEAFIAANRDLLAADIVVVSDGAMMAPDVPTITYGLKGLAYIEVRVRGASRDLHSGAYGGAVPNPINGLAKMIASLHDESGKITVPGFYDDVVDIGVAEREVFRRAPFDEAAFARQIGISATPGEAGYTVQERLWARPTLDVNGIAGGFQGEGAKTVIASEAMAKISCRLVPDQTPADITAKLGKYLREIAPAGLEVEIQDLHGGMPALTPMDSPAVRRAAVALESVYGKPPVFARTGGTIPVVNSFQELLGADVVLVGLGLENDRAHSPNEKFGLENYYKGIATSAALIESLASNE